MKTSTLLCAIFLTMSFIHCASAQQTSALSINASDTKPTATGDPHICHHPPINDVSPRDEQEGSTVVSFTIATDGHVKNPIVIQSSGWPLLDQDAVRCVADWTYNPATRNGLPVDTPWQARITTLSDYAPNRDDSKVTPPSLLSAPPCALPTSTSKIQPPVVALTVSDTGDVGDPAIEKSSGDPDVDKVALICVTKWKFNPAMQFGKTIVVRLHGTVR